MTDHHLHLNLTTITQNLVEQDKFHWVWRSDLKISSQLLNKSNWKHYNLSRKPWRILIAHLHHEWSKHLKEHIEHHNSWHHMRDIRVQYSWLNSMRDLITWINCFIQILKKLHKRWQPICRVSTLRWNGVNSKSRQTNRTLGLHTQ